MTSHPAISSDFADLLKELNAADVEYLVVGGYAFSHHVRPRATKDLDVLVRPTVENSRKTFAALAAFGAPLKSDGIGPDDFAREGLFYQLGRAPRRIDVITAIGGVTFEEAWKSRKKGDLGGVPTTYLGAAALYKNKRAVGRPQDVADALALEKLFPELAGSSAPPPPKPARRARKKR